MRPMPRLLTAALDLPLLSLVADPITLEAAAAPLEGKEPGPRSFRARAYTGGPVRLPSLDLPVVFDLSALEVSPQVPALRNHNPNMLVGHLTDHTNDGRELWAAGLLSAGNQHSREIAAASDNGFPWSVSVGIEPRSLLKLHAGQSIEINGRQFEGPLYVATGRLREISFVPAGADPGAFGRLAAEAGNSLFSCEVTEMNFAAWLKANGFEAEDKLSDSQRKALELAWKSSLKPSEPPANPPADPPANPPINRTPPANPPADPPADPLVQLRRERADEIQRMTRIAEICAQYESPSIEVGEGDQRRRVNLEAHAVAEGWDANQTELYALRVSRPQVPAIHTRGGEAPGANVLEAAACMSLNLAKIEEHFDEQTLEAAHTQFRGRIGMQEMLLEAAWQNGYQARVFRSGDLRGLLTAAFSTTSLPGILSNVANKFLLSGFMAIEQTWRAISSRKNVSDFKTMTSYRLTGDLKYEQLGPHGEIQHGKLGEQEFTNRAKTYARMLSIGREDIVNDDMDAMSAVPTRLGRGSALQINDVFWRAFLDHAAFFSVENKNLKTGSGSVLGIDALTVAEQAFFDQTDPDGNPLGIAPAILLVPNALNVTASTLMNSTEVRDNTANTKTPTANPHAGKFSVERSSYLNTAAIEGGSAKAWYLLASPEELPVIEVCFLDGQEMPTVETAEADFNQLGIQMRGFHDFGVAKQEHRAGVKSKGEN